MKIIKNYYLEFWGSDNPSGSLNQFESPFVTFKVKFPEEDRVDLYQSADLLIVTANFDQNTIDHYEYSYPIKFTECIGSGSPTFLYSPEEIGSVRTCVEEGIGILITKR
jgi:hypothetical protein